MVSGQLEIKKNYYYAVLNYKDGNGNRRENGYLQEYLPEKVINEKLRQSLQSFRLLL